MSDRNTQFRYDLYVYSQASKLLQAAKLIADTDPDWWEVWNGEPFSQELITDLVKVARRVNHHGVVQARNRKTRPMTDQPNIRAVIRREPGGNDDEQ